MLKANLLNSDALLNHFKEIETINYVAGENFDVVLRLKLDQLDIRYIPAAGATMSVDIENADGTTLTKTPTVLDADDRSIWKFTISAVESAALGATNMVITLTEGANVKKAVIQNSLSMQLISGEC